MSSTHAFLLKQTNKKKKMCFRMKNTDFDNKGRNMSHHGKKRDKIVISIIVIFTSQVTV